VIVTHNGPLTTIQEMWVALLVSAPGSALGGVSALSLDRFEGFATPSGAHHVVLPEGAARPSSSLVVPHWSTVLGAQDVHPLAIPRRTRSARSLVDEAAWSRAPRRARAVILAGVQQGLARPGDLSAALSRRGPCRHRALIRQSILDGDGGMHSIPERDFNDIVTNFHLPTPTRQLRLVRPDGHFFLDAGWDGLGAAVEVHGVPHMAVLNWDKDLFRANEISISGPRLLTFSSYAVRHEPDLVGAQLTRFLRSLGWTG
jgi:hypothetical protein